MNKIPHILIDPRKVLCTKGRETESLVPLRQPNINVTRRATKLMKFKILFLASKCRIYVRNLGLNCFLSLLAYRSKRIMSPQVCIFSPVRSMRSVFVAKSCADHISEPQTDMKP
jgi:hypothetical protein